MRLADYPIRTRLTIFVALMVIVVASLLNWIGFRFARESLTSQIQLRLDTIAHDREARIRTFAEQRKKEIALIASRTRLRKYLQQYKAGTVENEEFLRGTQRILSDAISSSPEFLRVWITDINGRIITGNDASRNGEMLADDPVYQQGRQRTHIGAPFMAGGNYLANLSAPVTTNDQVYLGVILAQLDVSQLRNILLDQAGLGQSGETLVGSIEGGQLNYLFPSKRHPSKWMSDPSQVPAMMRAINDETPGQNISDYEGKTVLVAWRNIHYQDPAYQRWGMIVKIDRNEAYAPITTLTGLQIFLEVVLVIVSIFLAWLLARQITAPIQQLVDASEKITGGDLTVEVSINSDDELGRLARSFNQMAAKLLRSRQDLEERVKERTRELQHAKDVLEKSNMDLQQFAYVASHDLQTPIRHITSYTQLLQKRYSGELDETAGEFIETIVGAAKKMQTLIQDLLAYSRVNNRERPFQQVDLNLVFETVIEMLAPSIEDSGANVSSGELPTVSGDPSQLSQLFMNLIGNAIKYHGDEPPDIKVLCEQQKQEFIISFVDNGIGIKPEYQDRIFDVFKRLHADNEIPGTGIGLAICKRVVERHGGRIWLESAEGAGSSFYIALPLVN